MVEKLQVYKCVDCGNIVEILTAGDGNLVCCGKPMVHLAPKSTDQGKEKHVPVIDEIITDGKVYRQSLKPGQAPEAVFNLAAERVNAREHCNLHGLWEVK